MELDKKAPKWTYDGYTTFLFLYRHIMQDGR